MKRDELVAYVDEYLRVREIDDRSQNGLQVEGPERVTRVAFAVDGCQASFESAVAVGAQLLVVHHGLFWDRPYRLVGQAFQRVRTLIEGGCYGGHYVTETLGVKALARHLAEKFGLETDFLDIPTGM